jgi:tetratricopeptide (TPR) repeat protein
MLDHLGALHRSQGRSAEARDSYERALVLHREVGNPLHEGLALACLASLYASGGDLPRALEHLDRGEALVRGVGHALGLSELLVDRAEVLSEADPSAARVALTEAERLAAEIGLSPVSEQAWRMKVLRERLGGASPTDGAS